MALNAIPPKQTSFKSSVSCDNPKFRFESISVETLLPTCRVCVYVCVGVCVCGCMCVWVYVCVCVSVYVCASNIDFASFYDFSIETWNCSDIVVCFVFIS
jgi:hypothetical protein